MSKRIDATIPDDVFAALCEIAQRQERSRSEMIAILLRDAVAAKRQEWRIHEERESVTPAKMAGH